MMTSEKLKKAWPYFRPFLMEVGVNIIIPILLYDYYSPTLGDTYALMISAIPPVLWSLIQVFRTRKLDALSLFVLLGIALSLLALIGGGSARFIQLRENLVNALISLVFLGSIVIGRPLLAVLARAQLQARQPDRLAHFDAAMQSKTVRKPLSFMTLIWGLGLLANALLSCVLVYMMSIPDYMAISPIMGYAIYGVLIAWTFWYSRHLKKKGSIGTQR